MTCRIEFLAWLTYLQQTEDIGGGNRKQGGPPALNAGDAARQAGGLGKSRWPWSAKP
jgi:hypothetical protein